MSAADAIKAREASKKKVQDLLTGKKPKPEPKSKT